MHGLDLFSGAYINKFIFVWCTCTVDSSVQVIYQVTCFCTCKQKQSHLLKHPAPLKIRRWTKPPPKWLCQLTSVMLCPLFWMFWCLIMGPKGCPKMSVRNFDFATCNIPEECRFHLMIWCYRPWFCSVWSGSEQSGLAWSTLALCTWILDDLTFKCQI